MSPYRDEPLVVVASFATSLEASLARGALEARGIRAFVPDEGLGSFSLRRGGIPPGTLQVFASDRAEAIAELWRLQLKVIRPEPKHDAAR